MSVFANTGQDCCARSRMFVERPVFDRFLERFIEATRKIVVGDPAKDQTQIGPLVSAKQRDRVEGFLKAARTSRHHFACAGDRPCEKGFFPHLTAILGCDPADPIWRDEVFGPRRCTAFRRETRCSLR